MPGALTSGAIDTFALNVNAAKETTNQKIAQVKSNKYAQYQQYQRYLAYLAWVAEQERLLAEAYRQYNIMLGNLASAYMQNMVQAIQQQQRAAALSKVISSIKGAAYSAVGSMFGNSSWKAPAPADFHGILDVVGLIPVVGEPADLANGIWYMVEGDATNAQLSAIGVFPIVGWLGTGGKVVSKIAKNTGEEAAEAAAKVTKNEGRIVNPTKGESEIWRSFDNVKGSDIKTDGVGKNQRFYKWDYTHNDIEVFDANEKHLGSMDPTTGEMYKPPVPGRKL